jgi:hypothetical protein
LTAIIAHADPAYVTVNLKLGSGIVAMSDLEILRAFNDIIATQEASIADPANRPVDIPKGRPQIEWLEEYQEWSSPRTAHSHRAVCRRPPGQRRSSFGLALNRVWMAPAGQGLFG